MTTSAGARRATSGSSGGPTGWGRQRPVVYWCRHGHRVEFLIAAEAETPASWECPRCGEPAGPDPGDPPGRQRAEPYKTHLAYVQERRTPEEGEALLAEALDALRRRRGRA
ncbi:RNA polymerase-binding protein RbpA [Micromonospora tulbaghiae]|uniref:RNA polymerase-binding protein RbpA n=1 Tax=Micromonospora tulbaghiae TaxID=479978 RepID=UPI0033E91081